MTTYFFPGQGSQQINMGLDLLKKFVEYREVASDLLGMSIEELLTKNPDNKLNQTEYTQPALFTVNALMFIEKLTGSQVRMRPSYLLGHSLGEYSALFAAGAFDFATGFLLVKKRGALMGQAKNGAMAAVVGLPHNKVIQLANDLSQNQVEVANLNAPLQTVISGPRDCILELETHFITNGAKRYLTLNVSGAFHSRYMAAIAKEFHQYLDTVKFKKLHTPVISNVTAKPYEDHSIRTLLTEQLTRPVQWTKSIEYLLRQNENDFIEVGPGTILTRLLQEIKTKIKMLTS